MEMERLVTNYMDIVNRNFSKSNLEIKKIKLGIEILLINISKLIVIISCAYMMDLTKYAILSIIVFTAMRRYSFGLHASSSIVCTVVSSILFIATAAMGKYNPLTKEFTVLIGLISILGIAKYAPADTKAHPLIGEALRRKLKSKAINVTSIIYCIALILNNNEITTIVVLTAFIQSLIINPIMYKLFKKEYGNYEKYEKHNRL